MKRLPLFTSALFAAACGGAQPADHASGHPGAEHHHHHGEGAAHGFSDVARFAAIFDDPERDRWQHPDEVVRLLELDPSMTVVDLGAGTGYFLPRLSHALSEGRVLALDTEPAMVAHIEQRVRDAGLSNVEARTVAPGDPGLAPESVDRILIVDTWHHL